MKTQGRIIAAILSVLMILTALPLATFAQTAEYADDGVQKSAYAGAKIDSEDAVGASEDTAAMDNAAVSYAAGKTFDEITGQLNIEYCTDDRDNFKPLPSGKDVANLCGVRISTNNSNFYLKYKSMNAGQKGWLDYVYSTKSGIYDYAGLPDKPMTKLSIEVYTSDGTRLMDDYVVMYRAKVPNQGWLNWVSNGDATVMHTIQGDYPDKITGGLDTEYNDTFAGWPPYGNIQALEIRMFERIEGNTSSSGGSTAPVEAGDFRLVDTITMKYRQTKGDTWTSFKTDETASFSSIDGILLETQGKPYYFRYAARDKTTGWNPYVSSLNADVDDDKNGYAGYKDRPITNIEIQVYTAGGRVYDNYVVMYRAKAGGTWLPWVSNGWPPIMKSLMPHAELDTGATDAGDGSNSIQALEIRVYERKGLDPTPSKNAKLIDAPYINQFNENLPNGCESASTVMALQYAVGKDKISLTTFINNYLDWTSSTPSPSRNSGPNPNKVYMGNPFPGYNDNSWGCFSPVIMKAVGKLENVLGVKATNASGTSLQNLCTTYIDKNIPVIMWATVGMTSLENCTIHKWVTPEGESISYNNKLHCLLLVGYDENNYFFNDPMAKKIQGYSKASVEAAYAALGSQAIVITKTSDGGTAVAPPKDTTVKDPVEIPKKPALSEEKVQDPIDLSTGAHVIDHTLMTVPGAQTLRFNISYRSNLLTDSSVGRGWTNNFEKKVIYDDGADIIKVFDDAAYYAVYKKSSEGSNIYTSETKTKENYTVTKTATPQGPLYTVNCNYGSTEYYNAAGQLIKITSKTGLNTLITYPNNSTVRITDEISGRYIQLAKNSDGKITSVTDNTGRTCTLGYIDGNLVSITDENGGMLSYQYNERGQIERGRDQNGTIYFTDTYDSAGRVISQKDAIEDSTETVIRYDETTDPGCLLVSVTDRTMQTTVYKYDSQKHLVSKTDPNGVETKYEYDNHGNLTKKTDGLGNSAINAYDLCDNLISSTDKKGQKTEYTYDAKNNLKEIKYPDGSTVTKTYENNLLTSSTDLRGVTTTYKYEQNLLAKVSYAGRTVTYTYDKGQPTTVTDPLGGTTTKTYNEAGFLKSVTDAQDNTTSYTYDDKGNVCTVTDAAGNVISKEYDKNGSLVKSTDAKGNVTSYTYNGNLKMTSMTLPNGKTIRYAYDGEDRLVKTIYPDETEAVNAYDAGGRLIKQTDRDGNVTAYEYDNANNVVKITDPLKGVTQKNYDNNGNLTELISSAGGTTTYTYDEKNRIKTVTNAMGAETVYEYNNAGDLLTVTDALDHTTINTYDDYGNLLTVTDPRGNTTTYTYNKADNLLTVTNALNQVTTNTYDSLNRLTSTTDPGGHVVSYTYDALGRMTAQTDARGNTVTREYDALGNVVKITNASGNVDYQAVYDSMGNATQVTDAAGSKTTNVYDWEGNLTEQTDALGNSSSYTYNGAGQMISAVDKLGNTSCTTYDGMGNITSTTDPEGNINEYIYNSAGQLNTAMIAEGDCDYRDYIYNAMGLKATVCDGNGYDTRYTYDDAGRIQSFTVGDQTVKYTYDENGNVLTVSDNTGTVKREYDALNRVIKYTDIYKNVVEYEYDCCGNLIKMTYPTGDVGVYTYDANHNMLSSGLEGAESYTTKYTYNSRNQVTKITRPDGSRITKYYDQAGRLTRTRDSGVAELLAEYRYTYDELGRITREVKSAHRGGYIYEMEYDAGGRLTKRIEYDQSKSEIVKTEEFTYDKNGNIVTDGDGNAFEYGSGNMMESANGKTMYIEYSGSGSMLELSSLNYYASLDYDERDRLSGADHGSVSYLYDAENNRINMYAYSTNTQYTYDTSDGRNRLVWTKDHTGAVTIYGYGADGLIWSKCGDEYQIYHYDYRGSVCEVTNQNGRLTDTLKYDAYGKVSEHQGESNLIFTYNGRDGVLTDPVGLLYMRARYYSPDIKRFVSLDPIEGSISNSSTLNRYTYVNGNPISFVDPFGLCREDKNNQSTESSVDRLEYMNTHAKGNIIYELMKFLNISFTDDVWEIEQTVIDQFGLTGKYKIGYSFQTSPNANVTIDSNNIQEVLTPEVTLPWTNVRAQVGAYIDGDRSSVGLSQISSYDALTTKFTGQVGLYSTARTLSFVYTPEDPLLPSVTISGDLEINHLLPLAVAGSVLVCVYAPQILPAAAAAFMEYFGTNIPVPIS